MSINQLNIIFAIGEVGLLFLILVFALVARWAGRREAAKEVGQLPVSPLKLHGQEGPATRAAAEFAALNGNYASLQPVRQLDTAMEKEHVEIAPV
jgi:hypothetical protein